MDHLAHVLPPSASLTKDGHLAIAGCDLVEVADEFGTPVVVYDEEHLRHTARAFRDALAASGATGEVIYASKAHFGLAVLTIMCEEGLSVDAATGGELAAALRAGFPAERIHLHGNNKSRAEIAAAVDAGVGTVILDNEDDITLLEEECASRGTRQRVLVRITPGVSGETHAYISTGQADSKFGFPLAGGVAHRAVAAVRSASHLDLVGLHVHVGSQLLNLDVFPKAAAVIAEFVSQIGGDDIEIMDMGGGLGIAYVPGQQPPSPAEFVEAAVGAVRSAWDVHGLPMPRVTIEPGRALVGRAGVNLYRVGVIKDIPGVRTYASLDGGMSDLLRPMLYDATYSSIVANRASTRANCVYRLVGKHCESGDVLIREAHLPRLSRDDVVCIAATGAYGMAMASNYNGQPRPPVVFVRDGQARLVARRETYDDLFAREISLD